MFNVNLNNNPGIQSDKISSSKHIDIQPDRKNIIVNSEYGNISNNKNLSHNVVFIFIMILFIMAMISLLYFKGEVLILNNFIDSIIIKVQNWIN